MHSALAQNPPPSPTRPSGQNTRVASGGWPATWVVQTWVPSTLALNAMKSVNVARNVVGSGDPGQVVQVLVRVEQHVDPAAAKPVDQRQRAHPGEVEQPAGQQQPSPRTVAATRAAAADPRPQQASASGVPQPTCGRQSAISGGLGRTSGTPAGSRPTPTTAAMAIKPRAATSTTTSLRRQRCSRCRTRCGDRGSRAIGIPRAWRSRSLALGGRWIRPTRLGPAPRGPRRRARVTTATIPMIKARFAP